MSQIINVTWNRDSASVGEDVEGRKSIFMTGAVEQASPLLLSSNVYVAGKTDGMTHFVFLPVSWVEGGDVIVNGVSYGAVKTSVAPASEWPDVHGQGSTVTQAHAELPAGDPRVDELVKLAENVSV